MINVTEVNRKYDKACRQRSAEISTCLQPICSTGRWIFCKQRKQGGTVLKRALVNFQSESMLA